MSDQGYATAFVVTPFVTDAEVAIASLAESGVAGRSCGDLASLAPAFQSGVGCVVLVEEVLVSEQLSQFREVLERQAPWADVPLIVIARDISAMATMIGRLFPNSGNVTFLEQPLNPFTLISAVQVALRATRRQLEVRDLLAQREQAVRSRDEFLAMLAHELRNPLAPIRNVVEIHKTFKVADPAFGKTCEILDRQVNHLVRMVDDLLDVARLERGKVALQLRQVDLNQVATSAVESCLSDVQSRGHRIELSLSRDELPIEGDVTRIEQILCNLVLNAAKFTNRPDVITVSTAKRGGWAAVSVKDNGIGMAPEALESMFKLFVQGDQSMERGRGGLGIGLTLARRLAELHHGSIDAHSAGIDKGAIFTARFPLTEKRSSPRFTGETGRTHAKASKRVVLIEDNTDILETMRMLLTQWGHRVSSAADGNEGLALVLREKPDVALVDIGLPGLNGYEIAEAIRKQGPNGIRLIAITGYGQAADTAAAYKAGFDTHLLKPIVPEALEQLLA